MPFPFKLPTTSNLSFVNHIRSFTHPTLIVSATIYRGVLRDVLKKHKRLNLSSQATNLSIVLSSLTDYLPYLFALDKGLNTGFVHGTEIDVAFEKELEVEWRPTLTASIPGREAARIKGHSLEYEIGFVLSSLAFTYTLLARVQLRVLYGRVTPTADQRTAAITAATRNLLSACSIYLYLQSRAEKHTIAMPVVDCTPHVISALASLAWAEATLFAVLKDDPYPAAVVQERNKDDMEWMIKSPEIPKVRAHLFARLCIAAADHAGRAHAMLVNLSSIDRTLVIYLDDLRRTARAKACRFLAIDADLSGKTGEAIAWLRGGKKELALLPLDSAGGGRSNAFAKFKKDWAEKREDKKIEKDGEWGTDAGRFEEGRVIEVLEKKWAKQNDTVNYQAIPAEETLVASMPSGREIHSPKSFVVPDLDAEILSRMRAPIDPNEVNVRDDASSEDNDGMEYEKGAIGAFPRARSESNIREPAYY